VTMQIDIEVLRRDVWKCMLTSRLSALYYQLTASSLGVWEMVGKVLLVVVVLGAVSLATAYKTEWVGIVGGAVIPFLAALLEVLVVKSRIDRAKRLYEKWSDLTHDSRRTWDLLNGNAPDWSSVHEMHIRLDERQRGICAEESTAPNRKPFV